MYTPSGSATPTPTGSHQGAKQPPSDQDRKPLPNHPGERDFLLRMSADAIIFKCGGGHQPVYYDVSIHNVSPSRQSFKVKCTSQEIFRVQPPIGFINSGDTHNIRVFFLNKVIPPEKDKHYFAFYHMSAEDKKKKVKDLWTKDAKPLGVRRLRAVFQLTK